LCEIVLLLDEGIKALFPDTGNGWVAGGIGWIRGRSHIRNVKLFDSVTHVAPILIRCSDIFGDFLAGSHELICLTRVRAVVYVTLKSVTFTFELGAWYVGRTAIIGPWLVVVGSIA
jgi:hypothetical protein